MTVRFASSSPPSVRSLLPAPTLNDPDTPLWASLYPVQQSSLEKAVWALVPVWFARPASGTWPAYAPARRPHWAWAIGALSAALVGAAVHLGWAAPALQAGAELARSGAEFVRTRLSPAAPARESLTPTRGEPELPSLAAPIAPSVTTSAAMPPVALPPPPAPAATTSERASSPAAPASKSKATRKKGGSSGHRTPHRGSHDSSRSVPAAVRTQF